MTYKIRNSLIALSTLGLVGICAATPSSAQTFNYTKGTFAPGTVTFNGTTAFWTGAGGSSSWTNCKVNKNGGSCNKGNAPGSFSIQGNTMNYRQ